MAIYYSTLTLIILVLSIVCLSLLLREWNRREKQMAELTKRVRDLENANNKRLPHRAADELLDAMAVLDLEIEKQEIETERLKNIQAHITNAMATGTKREAKEK